MCMLSFVGDAYSQSMPKRYPWAQGVTQEPVSRDEFEALRREIEEMKKLLIAAKRIDEITNQKDCEKPDKVAILKQLAELVGVSLEDVLS